jgi:DNA uptake protein ComE-like DNA-binding protein
MIRSIRPLLLCTVFAAAACGGGSDSETGDALAADTGVAAAPASDTTTATPAAAPAPADSGFIDPNTASREQLLTVPHMTPALADSLVAGRPYADMRGVDRVLGGLSETQKDEVYARLWKPLDLNSATAEEIELIPRVGERMRHEFEEYRPYRGIEQFRREIGKYVDEAEVARLERYVTIGS